MHSKNRLFAVLAVVLFVSPVLAAAEPARSPASTAAFADAKAMLGTVPMFLSETPDPLVAPFWEQVKALQLSPTTALDGKTKELIGLGVAAQVPCRYCVYAHGELAKLGGATPADLRESVATAALARELSALSNAPAGQGSDKNVSPEVAAVYQEATQQLGSLPAFLERTPAASKVSLWKQVKAGLLSTSGTLGPKHKALISLAVAVQLPSASCVKDFTAMARANGASEQELQEAVAMSGLTRMASTILNGSLTDEAAWRRSIDGVVSRMTRAAKRTASR